MKLQGRILIFGWAGAALCASCIFNSPYNVGIDGPDVLLGEKGNDRLRITCWNKLFVEHLQSWGEFSNKNRNLIGAMLGTYCSSPIMHPNKMYLVESVEYCQKVIVNIRAINYEDFLAKYMWETTNTCHFVAVEFFKFQKPFQGSMIVIPDK